MALDPWYRNAVIYAVDVEKFADGDGDGIGDLAGLIGRLDYIDRLGVTCLWLLPFYPSPRLDNGYDPTDLYGVDPRFGSLAEFDLLVRACGERGIRVVVDIVMDHTSDEHPWFQAARRDKLSRFRDYYTWVEMPPRVGLAHNSAFPGEESSLWKYDIAAGAYYYHPFYRFQPQLNMANPEVVNEFMRVLDFWLSFGVSGFRLDAVPLMLGLDGPAVNLPKDPHGILREARELVSSRRTDGLLMGEVDLEAGKLLGYFGEGDELNALLGFLLNNYLWLAFATEDPDALVRGLRLLPSVPDGCQWVNFLRNHDELNIQWLPEADRHHVWDTFAPDAGMRIYERGIRRRTAPMLGNADKNELAMSLLFALPGSPLLMYGDEIGMGENLDLPGRDAVRTPMQWSSETSAGFSTAEPERLVRPVVDSGPYAYQHVNAEVAELEPDSLFHAVQRLAKARREAPEIGGGNWHVLDVGSPKVLCIQYVSQDRTVMVLHNFCADEQVACVDLRDLGAYQLESVIECRARSRVRDESHEVTFGSYGYAWYRTILKPTEAIDV